ncbi:tRNA (adenosine(37)-N6)-threonylcarbamoyltransferase complex ATPase subunit type 1 TsaE [Virgibacillus sp. NKC19-16]|uniref:tRNA (adenosine(37)-N6)-threonylcarbamoyltransferase complex ATPase subunit type 1 TsaE n=1 Tax=Virgibacillus salidurans TaxID=2831673 RepID=UPI001F00EFCC|nr:tRNA (adenosine(37)-N6)-threonylcarbamoyltransferase complex ATPase subunit type 1 TsaE [Virgibacillus sp. NKC19-16]UJL47113.1 tRNA (adenosine(37)-N6)-threonylcarbamoyltransferase complex ATPase subunit type 1 TsaE [Virgibacillus sp. NKC19-16]
MIDYQIKTYTTLETTQLAQALAVLLRPGDLITLDGELGTGKTTFTKGLGTGLGIKRTISSPTFTIVKEYEGELPLYHMDAYRLQDSDEDIGFEEYFDGEGVTVVEWATYIEEFLPDERLKIMISYIDEHTRGFDLTPVGDHYQWVVKELQHSNL